jgi:alpha-galactosidase
MNGPKFVLIGGGSYGWTPTLMRDIALNPHVRDLHVVLMDIDPDTLAVMVPLCRKIVSGRDDIRVEGTTDLDAALPGADFVGLTITTGGDASNLLDIEIPARHGILQTVGDTVGPGGWSRALRNIPVVVDIARRVEALAPKAWFMNYSNPMTVITRAVCRARGGQRTMGICHELQGLLLHLATFFGVDWQKDFAFTMAGINHLIWVLSMTVRGRDAFPLFLEWGRDPVGFEKIGDVGVPPELILSGGVWPHQRVKLDQLRRTGCLPAAGDAHIAEFFSHYLSSPEEMRRWDFTPGERAHTFARSGGRMGRKQRCEAMLSGARPIPTIHSHEHADYTIAALSGMGPPLVTPLNLANRGQIDNVPREAVVETMVYLDADGAHPLAVGAVPSPVLHSLMQHIPNQEMLVEAGLTGNRELAVLALANDPLIPNPDVALRIADDFFQQYRPLLPQFNGGWSL